MSAQVRHRAVSKLSWAEMQNTYQGNRGAGVPTQCRSGTSAGAFDQHQLDSKIDAMAMHAH